MRVLVFGGSFDPPHRGHLALLAAAADRVRPDRILIVPAWRAPDKGSPSASPSARAAMARLGVLSPLPARWRKIARVDPSETRSGRPVYTVETLSKLKARDPAGELHFVCGQDSAARFPSWKDPERLRALATWWYGPRPGAEGAPPSFFRRVPARLPDVSSTELRAALAAGKDCSKDILPGPLEAIRRRGLYGGGLLARLRETLPPMRYEHTLNVASLAEALARRHGEDPDKARLAALLHDAGRRFPAPLMARYAKRRRLKVPEADLTSRLEPLLLHAHISEDLARREFGVKDPAVLSAIRKHTLGDAEMSRLDVVVYVADACSADRVHPGTEGTRALAFQDLDSAFRLCVADKLVHALRRGGWLHPVTTELWNRLASR